MQSKRLFAAALGLIFVATLGATHLVAQNAPSSSTPKPSIELRQLAKEALSKNPDPDPLLTFSQVCRADLENVRRTTA